MKENILFSIVVAIYNVEMYLAKCIDSITNQTYKNIEIVLVDDGSTDGSGKIIDEYAKKDDRIIVVHKANSGVSDARNIGFEHSSGEYILYIDSDDWVSTDMCRVIAEVIQEHPDADIIQYGNQTVIDGEKEKSINDEYYSVKVFDSKEATKRMLAFDHFRHEPWSRALKRELATKVKFPKGRVAEDLAIAGDFFCNSKKCVLIDKELYFYRIRPKSIMTSKSLKLLEDTLYAVDNFYKSIISFYNDLIYDLTERCVCDLFHLYFECTKNTESGSVKKNIKIWLKNINIKNCKYFKTKFRLFIFKYCRFIFVPMLKLQMSVKK